MPLRYTFKRYELKYFLSPEQEAALRAYMQPFMRPDDFGKSTICNLYFDTPDYRIIRRSIEKPVYKEKLRLRSYGVAQPEKIVFAELKKKYKGIVYKRRIGMRPYEAMQYLCNGVSALPQTQIKREMDYFLNFYPELKPSVCLSYDREAFFAKEDPDFRITFDRNILWRQSDLDLSKGAYGRPVLPDDRVLMEIKTADSVPLWLTKFLSHNHIYKTAFSKYGTAYQIILQEHFGGKHYA